MERMLPLPALAAIVQAVELDALSESLDAAMAARLGPHFEVDRYVIAYRETASRGVREQQVQYVEAVGSALCSLVRVPLLGTTLVMMRGPAKLARLAELQNFLERGFTAFRRMQRPREFVAMVAARQRRIMEQLYAASAAPFNL